VTEKQESERKNKRDLHVSVFLVAEVNQVRMPYCCAKKKKKKKKTFPERNNMHLHKSNSYKKRQHC